jgi:protein SCO1/2
MKLTIVLCVLLAACSGTSPEPAVRATPVPAPVAQPVARPPATALGPSIYELDLPLRDASDREISLDVHRGHPVIISMFYGNCAVACPALIGYLKQVTAQADPNTRVLLVSFDRAHDTPAHLAELVATHDLAANWTLASASPTDARTLAAILGIKYRETGAGQYAHNSVILALDGEGRPIARLEGLRDSRPLIDAVAAAGN